MSIHLTIKNENCNAREKGETICFVVGNKGSAWVINLVTWEKGVCEADLFPVEHTHCTLTTKFVHTLFLMMCVFTNHQNAEKTCYKMVFDLNMLKTSVKFMFVKSTI